MDDLITAFLRMLAYPLAWAPTRGLLFILAGLYGLSEWPAWVGSVCLLGAAVTWVWPLVTWWKERHAHRHGGVA